MVDGLVQGGRNSSALALELRLSCTNPSILNMTDDNFLLNAYPSGFTQVER